MNTKARIRIYSLEEKGISFSYVTSSCMIVVGGRYDNKNQVGLKYEKELMEFPYIDTLVIPGWDKYCCRSLELQKLMDTYQPDRIFYPERLPNDESEQKCLDYINNYNNLSSG